MRLDPERMKAQAQAFAFPRQAETEGDSQAVSKVIESLTRAGWQVETRSVGPSRRRKGLNLLISFPWVSSTWVFLFASFLAWRGGWNRWGVGLTTGMGLLSFGIALSVRRRLVNRSSLTFVHESRTVLATRPTVVDPPVRMLLVTELSPPPPRQIAEFLFISGYYLSYWLVAFTGIVGVTSPDSRVLLLIWACIPINLALMHLLGRERYWKRSAFPRDNRTGLAVLLELAESLSDGTRERVEFRLVVAGSDGRQGLIPILKTLHRDWPFKPTLIVSLDNPGLGKELALGGQVRALDLVKEAARDLWLPHKVTRFRNLHLPWYDVSFAVIGSQKTETKIVSEGMVAAASLVQELALRWAKQAKP